MKSVSGWEFRRCFDFASGNSEKAICFQSLRGGVVGDYHIVAVSGLKKPKGLIVQLRRAGRGEAFEGGNGARTHSPSVVVNRGETEWLNSRRRRRETRRGEGPDCLLRPHGALREPGTDRLESSE